MPWASRTGSGSRLSGSGCRRFRCWRIDLTCGQWPPTSASKDGSCFASAVQRRPHTGLPGQAASPGIFRLRSSACSARFGSAFTAGLEMRESSGNSMNFTTAATFGDFPVRTLSNPDPSDPTAGATKVPTFPGFQVEIAAAVQAPGQGVGWARRTVLWPAAGWKWAPHRQQSSPNAGAATRHPPQGVIHELLITGNDL